MKFKSNLFLLAGLLHFSGSPFSLLIPTARAAEEGTLAARLYCGSLGDNPRVDERIQCTTGPGQKSLSPFQFTPGNFWVETAKGQRVPGNTKKENDRVVSFTPKHPFQRGQTYVLKIDLSKINQKAPYKLTLSWMELSVTTGTVPFCFKGFESIIDGAHSNLPIRSRCVGAE